jgi:hypothetical protein
MQGALFPIPAAAERSCNGRCQKKVLDIAAATGSGCHYHNMLTGASK